MGSKKIIEQLIKIAVNQQKIINQLAIEKQAQAQSNFPNVENPEAGKQYPLNRADIKPDANFITALQKFLMANGYFQADGIMGPQTSAALKTWQQKNSSDPWLKGKATGQLDGDTIQALYPYLLKYM